MAKLRLRFWMWAHDAAERLWHWIYYTKIAPRPLPLKSVYQYEILYSRSSDGAAVSHDGITWTQPRGSLIWKRTRSHRMTKTFTRF